MSSVAGSVGDGGEGEHGSGKFLVIGKLREIFVVVVNGVKKLRTDQMGPGSVAKNLLLLLPLEFWASSFRSKTSRSSTDG